MTTYTSLLLAATLFLPAGRASAEHHAQSPLHGALVQGPHAVGFRTLAIHDASRSRPLTVLVWYPARPDAAGQGMTYTEALLAHLATAPEAERTAREAQGRQFFAQFGQVDDQAWARLKDTRLHARRDAPPADGRYPLLIGQLRPLSTNVTNEYLASHGFVVAMTYGSNPQASSAGAGLEIGYRDMEFAIPELRKLPMVDQRRLGALGFSGAGFSQILLAMRHPDVQAVCDLESAIFDGRMMWPLAGGWGYDVGAMRVPFLHTYSVPLSKLEDRIGDFEKMRYSTRYRYLVDAPGIHHWDFATEGMAASTVLGLRAENAARLRAVFETTNRYVLAFVNAYLKDDAGELAFLKRDPAANGAPAGLATITELPGIRPAPTPADFERMIVDQGPVAAIQEFDAARARDGQAPLFDQTGLNAMGYRVLRQHAKPEAAIAIFRKVVDLYPASTNAYDSLSEALEGAGNRAEALSVAKRGLEMLEKESLTPERRQQLGDLLRERVKRLQ
jgi:hypothetical protein